MDPPKYTDLEQMLNELKAAETGLQNSGDLEKTSDYLEAIELRALKRLDTLEEMVNETVPSSHHVPYDGARIAKNALWLSAMTVPISAWADFSRAGNVFDALRRVNGNYAELSDSEIWVNCLLLPSDSLVGLISLTKGAYFETLVADTTGGVLFENFNHPDTDIVIDGIAFQLKATDSVTYVNSVADGIPIIATSEVAQVTDAFDVGIENVEIQQVTELALGGSIIDFHDTAVDAVLTGVGGLGILATIRGIHHAAKQFKSGVDGEVAIAEGVEVAVVGTVKSFVDTAELGYKALTSRPMRFAGRQTLKLTTWIAAKV